MSELTTYTEGKILHFKVAVGRKSQRGFTCPIAALSRGIEMALADDARLQPLIDGKPLDRQVGIVFGAETRERYFNQQD